MESWDGPVFWNEQFHTSLEDAIECMEDCEQRPEWLYVAKRCPPRLLDAQDILERYAEDMGDDGYDYLRGVKEFEAACDAFNEANKAVEWYKEDSTRCVRVPPQEDDPCD
jgi:hypothetical protein